MPQENTWFAERTRIQLDAPEQFAVVFHNDDFTTMDFVMDVLINIFFKSQADACALMLKVHEEGRGVAGVYPLDIARSKATKALLMAREEGFPLKITLEKV